LKAGSGINLQLDIFQDFVNNKRIGTKQALERRVRNLPAALII
jgi:hypothetical protein